jgi:polyhydroxyalkanoate synthesis regulator phasin
MAAPASLKELLEQLTSELGAAGNLKVEDARRIADQLVHRWRGDAARAGESAGAAMDGLFQQLGLVTRDDFEELELRVAQLEHRLRLVEGRPASGDGQPS